MAELDVRLGRTRFDKIYNTNKSFRDFVANLKKIHPKWRTFNWEKAGKISGGSSQKHELWKLWEKAKTFKTKAGYNTTSKQLAAKLGITESDLHTRVKGKRLTSTGALIEKLFPKISTGRQGGEVLYKDPTPAAIKEFKTHFKKSWIKDETTKRVKEIDKLFRKMVVEGKKGKHLPDLFEVMEKTSSNTPSKAAHAMAIYSRALRGEEFRTPLDIRKNNSAGQRLLTELGSSSRDNPYRTAFYRLALDNVNKQFNQSGTLGDFQKDFRTKLREAMRLKPGEKIPYNINEVISVSAGETRGIKPFSVFVDATSAKINSGALAGYQGRFSERLEKVQELLSQKKPDIAGARLEADKLLESQKAIAKTLVKQGFTEAQIKQLNLPEIVVSKTIDPKHYAPKDLARWKKQTKGALDISQFVKDKGYYIDIKKAKPFWESNVNNTVIAAARNNVGNICNIFKGRIAFSAEGGRIGFQGGCGREMTIAMQTDSKGTLQQITKTEGIIPKFKNVAQGFLGTLGKWGPRIGKYGAIAAAGAVAQPLVKQFRNDDPSTYLTDPDQQAGMLTALIEGERPKPRSEILDWGIGAGTLGATAAAVPGTSALYKARRLPTLKREAMGPLRAATIGPAMKLLSGMFTPAGILATEPLRIAQKRREGESWGDIATDPVAWMGPAFAPSMTRMATRGMNPSSVLPKLLRLGMSRAALAAMGPVGWAGLAASLGWTGYEQYQDYKKGRGFFASEE